MYSSLFQFHNFRCSNSRCPTVEDFTKDGYDSKQTDCRTYTVDDVLTYANRYSIREESHNSWDQSYLHDDQIIFQKFVGEVNSGINNNNKKGTVDATPTIAYHSIDNNGDPYSTDVNLFAAEMKYLYDNGFKVISMSDLGYDEITKSMYIISLLVLLSHPI